MNNIKYISLSGCWVLWWPDVLTRLIVYICVAQNKMQRSFVDGHVFRSNTNNVADIIEGGEISMYETRD